MAYTLNDPLTYARTQLLRSDTNQLPDADGVKYANDATLDCFMEFLKRREDFFVQEDYRAITSAEIVGGAQPGRFALPSDNILIKQLEINLTDPTNQSGYIPARLVDVSNLDTDESWEYLKLNQPMTDPIYDYRGDWFEIAPTPTTAMIPSPPLANALRLFYFIQPTPFVATTDSIPYPYSLNPNVIAYKIAEIFLRPFDEGQADKYEKQYLKRVAQIIDAIGPGEQNQPRPRGVQLTGDEF